MRHCLQPTILDVGFLCILHFLAKPNLHSDSLVSKGIIKFFCLSTGSFISNGPYRRYTFAYGIDQFTNLITFHSTLSVSYNSSEKFPHSINTEGGKIKSQSSECMHITCSMSVFKHHLSSLFSCCLREIPHQKYLSRTILFVT